MSYASMQGDWMLFEELFTSVSLQGVDASANWDVQVWDREEKERIAQLFIDGVPCTKGCGKVYHTQPLLNRHVSYVCGKPKEKECPNGCGRLFVTQKGKSSFSQLMS